MQLLNLSQLAFVAAMFSAQAIAGDKKVPPPSDLGLKISDGKYYGWKDITSDVDFSAYVYVTKGLQSIQVEKLKNPENILKSYEAVLSIWKDQSELTLEDLDHISYNNVPSPDLEIVDKALRTKGRDPFKENPIYGVTISRDSEADEEAWNHLITASFAKEAEEICDEYEGMSNRYIKSFVIGVDCDYHNRFVSIYFGTKGDQDTENTLP
ncbi:hypothetical protein HOO65_070017 [Ceratocystis lukuohia]|uniref:Uncharacterized protein n=1 Tax=Ceratocystis lukuohia TaxID=2019550 RepID=A0ABR4MBB2_9PEZI